MRTSEGPGPESGLVCSKCGRSSSFCECENSDIDYDGFLCGVCLNLIDTKERGISFHICEICAMIVCDKCAIPVVDVYGEPHFMCLRCRECK